MVTSGHWSYNYALRLLRVSRSYYAHINIYALSLFEASLECFGYSVGNKQP